MKRALTFILTTLLTVACQQRGQQPAATPGSDTTLVVALERGPCYGTCPVYSVELFESGRVAFNGTRFVSTMGAATDSISVALVDSIQRLISASGFAAFDTAYVMGSPGCGNYATDMPVTVLKAFANSSLKTIRREGGCSDAPRVLDSLAASVDSITGTAKWIKGG